MDGGGLPAHHQRFGGVRAFAGRQRAQQHGADHQRRHALLLGKQAGNVALADVAEFVRQHRGQLVAAAHHAHQPQMHAQVAARQGKSVHAAVAPQQHRPGKALVQLLGQFAARAGRLAQRVQRGLHILLQRAVVEVVGVAVELADDVVANAPLVAHRQLQPIAQ